ncbi:MAG: DUF6352 family protein [Rhizobiaceae bacterium]
MEFWKSAGMHLVERDGNGWLKVTPDYLRAYFTRPEIHPVEESCAGEHKLFEKIMDDPFVDVAAVELDAIVDQDAADNYRVLLRYRDHLISNDTLEAAYMALFSGDQISIPPMFIDQMVHLILRNILDEVDDPLQLRAAELFFREQAVTTGDDQLMLADQEIVEMRSETGGFGGLGQLIADAGTPMRDVSLDVLTDENKAIYWERSDQFDTAIDFRFTQAAPDALGRVIEKWVQHFLGLQTRVHAMQSITDERWSWHIGCDTQSNQILNALYNGDEVEENELFKILALYRLEFLNPDDANASVRGKPVYLGVAMNDDKKLLFKPQNLLMNLPINRD